MLSNNNKYLLNYCNNIAHLCLRDSQSLFIQRRLHAWFVDRLSFSVYRRVNTRVGGYGRVDPGVVDLFVDLFVGGFVVVKLTI